MATNASNAVALPAPFRAFLVKMESEADISESDPGASPLIGSFQAILEAETEEEMWVADDLAQIGGRDIRDVEQQILDFRVKRSSAQNDIQSTFIDSQGRGMYVLVTAVRLADGVQFTWNTSAPLVVGKLFWLAEREMLPHECVIRGTDIGGGQTVLKLKPIPARAIKA